MKNLLETINRLLEIPPKSAFSNSLTWEVEGTYIHIGLYDYIKTNAYLMVDLTYSDGSVYNFSINLTETEAAFYSYKFKSIEEETVETGKARFAASVKKLTEASEIEPMDGLLENE